MSVSKNSRYFLGGQTPKKEYSARYRQHLAQLSRARIGDAANPWTDVTSARWSSRSAAKAAIHELKKLGDA
jgi:hypothetical protein